MVNLASSGVIKQIATDAESEPLRVDKTDLSIGQPDLLPSVDQSDLLSSIG